MFQGEGESQFIQAAGLAFDNHGNFLAICSKTSRISAFRADGSFMCDVSIGLLLVLKNNFEFLASIPRGRHTTTK